MPLPLKRAIVLLCAAPLALGVGACAKTVSTSGFQGEQREVAKTISNLQSDVTGGDEKKLCSNDLAASIVTKLNAANGGCKEVVKGQLAEIDGFELSVQSIQIKGTNATAHVLSVYSGKKRPTTISLVKEPTHPGQPGRKWKVAGVSSPS